MVDAYCSIQRENHFSPFRIVYSDIPSDPVYARRFRISICVYSFGFLLGSNRHQLDLVRMPAHSSIRVSHQVAIRTNPVLCFSSIDEAQAWLQQQLNNHLSATAE